MSEMLRAKKKLENDETLDCALDAELVIAAQAGSPQAFTALVEKYYRLVYILSLAQLRSPEAAEELTQEVFVRVHLHLHKLREPLAFAGWLRRIARNESCRWLSRKQLRSELLPLIPIEELGPDVFDNKAVSPRQQAAERQELAALKRALDNLSPAEREMILLHYIEGQSKSDLARQLGMHHTTVGRQLERIKGTLRDELDPFVGDAVQKVADQPAGLARTIAAVGAVAAMPVAERAALAEKFGHCLDTAMSAGSATGTFAGTKATLAALAGAGKTKLAGIAAVAAAGAIAYVAVPEQFRPWHRESAIYATVGESEFSRVLRESAPSDYVVRVRKAPQDSPSASLPGGRISDALQASLIGAGANRTISRTAGFREAALAQIVTDSGPSYTTAHFGGVGGDGFEGRLYNMPVRSTVAALRGIPTWSVEQFPQNTPQIDTIFRTPLLPEVQMIRAQSNEDIDVVYGPFFSNVNKKVSDRFLQEAGLKLASRTIAVPVIRIKSTGTSSMSGVAQVMPDYSKLQKDPAKQSSEPTHNNPYLSTWDSPLSLERVAWAFRVQNTYPALLEVDPSVKKQDPVHWSGSLKLLSGAHPGELGQLLSYTYNLPYEVVWQEYPVYLVYDESSVSKRDVEAWQNADARVTSLR